MFLGIGILLIAVLLSVLMTVTRPTTQRQPPDKPAPADVSVIFAAPEQQVPIVTTTAKVTAKRDINLTVQVAGLIQKVESNFSRGAMVNEGDLLVTIEDQDYLTAVARAESELARAKEALATEKGAARQARREWRDLNNSEANDLFLRRPRLLLPRLISGQPNSICNRPKLTCKEPGSKHLSQGRFQRSMPISVNTSP